MWTFGAPKPEQAAQPDDADGQPLSAVLVCAALGAGGLMTPTVVPTRLMVLVKVSASGLRPHQMACVSPSERWTPVSVWRDGHDVRTPRWMVS